MIRTSKERYTRFGSLATGALVAVLVSVLLSSGQALEPGRSDKDKPGIQGESRRLDLAPELLAAIVEDVKQAMGLRDVSIQQFDAAKVAQAGGLSARLGQRRVTMQLHPYSLRAGNFQLLVQDATGALNQVAPPAPATYRGTVLELPGASVAATIVDSDIWAMIQTGPDERWHVQPVSEVLPGAPRGLHAVYNAKDAIGGQGVCGVHPGMLPVGGAAPAAGGESTVAGGLGRTEIAFDADFEFYQLNGSSVGGTVIDIENVMNQVGLIYQSQVGICYANTGIIVRTVEPDPYFATNAVDLLCEFTGHWNSSVFIPRDMAHLMTGKNLSGGVGIAWPAVICGQVFDLSPVCPALSNGTADYGVSQSRASTNMALRVNITAHEIGHNWSACHCNQSDCTGGGADPDCGIMLSVGIGSSTFGSRSVNTIVNYRNTRGCLSPCMGTVFVDWRNEGPEDGSPGNPFDTVAEGIANAMEWPRQVSIASGSYPENLTVAKPVRLTSSGGTVTIGN